MKNTLLLITAFAFCTLSCNYLKKNSVLIKEGKDGGASSSMNSTQETIVLAPYQVDCQGAFPQKCFVQILENGETAYFYEHIEKFNFIPGYQYKLLVEKTPRCTNHNPLDCPQDIGIYRYTLKSIISKKKIQR